MIRVLIADDHDIVRQGIKTILADAHGIVVGGEAVNGIEVLIKLRTDKYDVVLLDLSMPCRNGFDCMQQIMERHVGVKVLILSTYTEDQFAVRLMKAGASGYMRKDISSKHLVDAIRKVVSGKKFISENLSELLLQECNDDTSKPPHELLSNREYQLLRLIGAGEKPSDIAKSMSISTKTVSSYRSNLLAKMKLQNNAQLVAYVIEKKLMELQQLQTR